MFRVLKFRWPFLLTAIIIWPNIVNADFDCNSLPNDQQLNCQTENWVLGEFKNFHQNYGKYIIRTAGCKLIYSDIVAELRSCRQQLGSDFGCKLAIAIMNVNRGINNTNIKAQCCPNYPRCS